MSISAYFTCDACKKTLPARISSDSHVHCYLPEGWVFSWNVVGGDDLAHPSLHVCESRECRVKLWKQFNPAVYEDWFKQQGGSK